MAVVAVQILGVAKYFAEIHHPSNPICLGLHDFAAPSMSIPYFLATMGLQRGKQQEHAAGQLLTP